MKIMIDPKGANETLIDQFGTKEALAGTLMNVLALNDHYGLNQLDWVDMLSLEWSSDSPGKFYSTALKGIIKGPTTVNDLPAILCTSYLRAPMSVYSNYQAAISVAPDGGIFVKNEALASLDEFLESLPGSILAYQKI